ACPPKETYDGWTDDAISCSSKAPPATSGLLGGHGFRASARVASVDIAPAVARRPRLGADQAVQHGPRDLVAALVPQDHRHVVLGAGRRARNGRLADRRNR